MSGEENLKMSKLVLESSSHLPDYLRMLDDEAVFEAIFHNITNIQKLKTKKTEDRFGFNDALTLNKFTQQYRIFQLVFMNV